MSAFTKDLLLEAMTKLVDSLKDRTDERSLVIPESLYWEIQKRLLRLADLTATVREFIEVDDDLNINGRDYSEAERATFEEEREKLFEKMREYTK